MNSLTPFKFEEHQVRTITDTNGEPWFNANDVCSALEFANPHKAIADHIDTDDLTKREVIDALGRQQRSNFINESGLYALIFGSTKDAAKRFKRWVTHEVLPSLRKTGTYSLPQKKTDTTELTKAAKLFPFMIKAARAFGLDNNAAAISANQAVVKATGTNMLELLGQTHLEATV